MKPLFRIVLWASGIAILGYILLVGFVMFWPSIKSYSLSSPFDSTQWKASVVRSDNIKQKMLSDLLAKHKLIGLGIEEVNQLLGKPPETTYFKDYDYVYWLGPERGIGVDSEWLGIKFENGIVAKVEILQD